MLERSAAPQSARCDEIDACLAVHDARTRTRVGQAPPLSDQVGHAAAPTRSSTAIAACLLFAAACALPNQALRLPGRARDELEALARELSVAGAEVSPTEAVRGLCLLAVELADGMAGPDFAAAVLVAARDSTQEGALRAVKALGPLLDGEPSTTPRPPTREDASEPGCIPPPSLRAA